jgi:hypothetical protein
MKNENCLLGEFTCMGMWWSPENPSEKIYGFLKFNNKNIRLELAGVFSKKYTFQSLILETIHGLTNENKKVTLYKVSELYFKGPHITDIKNNFGESVFSCEYIFIGRHFNHADDIIFNGLGMDFTYLNEWINNKFEYEWDKDDYSIKSKSFGYTLNLDFISSTLNIFSEAMNLGDLGKDIRICYISGISIKPHEAKNWRWFQEFLNNFKNFLTLLMGIPVYPSHLSADPINSSKFESIEIFYCIPNPLIIESLHPREIEISFPDIIKYTNRNVQKIGDVINNWLKRAEVIAPVFDLFFLTFYDNSMSVRTCFLTLMQAIETFHRRVYEGKGKYLDDIEYKPIYEIISKANPENIEEGLKKSLKGRLRYGNEFSLMTRLESLENYGKGCKWFKMIMRGENGILWKLVATRNYYTHFDEKNKINMIREEDLPYMNYKLRLFLRILLLEEINNGILPIFDVVDSFLRRQRNAEEESQFLQHRDNSSN